MGRTEDDGMGDDSDSRAPDLAELAEQHAAEQGLLPDRVHQREADHTGHPERERAVLQVVFDTLFARVPDLRLARPVQDLPFKDDGVIYGLYELPVTW